MEAKELRFDNWVIYTPTGEYVQMNIAYFNNLIDCDTNFSPIPLTPDILEKCGFKYYKKDCEYSLGDFKIIHWNQNGYLLSSYEPIEIWESPKMEIFNTVHDLQNIYYAHKKKELKIEL